MRGHAKRYLISDTGAGCGVPRVCHGWSVINLAMLRWVGVVAMGIVTGVMLSRLYSWPVVLDNCVLNPITGCWECCPKIEHTSTGARCAAGTGVRVLENSISDL